MNDVICKKLFHKNEENTTSYGKLGKISRKNSKI